MNKVKLFNNKQKNNHYSMDKIYPRNVSFYCIVEWQKADPATHVFQPFLLQLQKLILFSFSNHVAGNRFFLKSYLINDLFRYNYGHKNIKFISLPQLFASMVIKNDELVIHFVRIYETLKLSLLTERHAMKFNRFCRWVAWFSH